ncbi:MAG TPA: methylated-DNA--[protein]-cysteine S-methyltransferase [Chitinophagaceae bacterium]|nr:methylated-DNA--[protein]-cysteine S-methyltransferase [Chitinophagaceae bacterium]
MTQESLNYQRIAEAIRYIEDNFQNQPSLEEVAEQVHLSPFHFQRLFSEWAGVSPKKFLQFISIEHAKAIIRNEQASLFDVAAETGLSGTGRLHDLFIQIEGMTPGEYKNGGESLLINYDTAETPFGPVLVASTSKGICHMAFADIETAAIDEMQQIFPHAKYQRGTDEIQQNALLIFRKHQDSIKQIKLHLKGTEFQLKVWQSLLKIPMGRFTTYGQLANQLENPKASRAVGSAVGDNPVAYLIPCHRVIQSSGHFGQYHWGSLRKTAMLGWEAAVAYQDQ